MPKVLCTLPNAADEINGHKFKATEDGMLSEDLSDEAAEHFLSIPGYEAVDGGEPRKQPAKEPAAKVEKAAKAPAAAKAEKTPKAKAEAPAPAPAPAEGAGDVGGQVEGGEGGKDPETDETVF